MNVKTKAGRKEIAKLARRYGHFQHPVGPVHGSTLSVICPLCNEKVSIYFSIYQFKTVSQALDAAMDDHLIWEHG